MKHFGGILLLILSLCAAPLYAQDTSERSCDPSEWGNFKPAIIEQLDHLEANPLETLLLLQTFISSARATCTGGEFTNETHPNGIIGPIYFSGTLYQATLTVPDTYGSVRIRELEGDCDAFILQGPVAGGSETDLWQFKNCVAMFEVNLSGTSDWHFIIERLR